MAKRSTDSIPEPELLPHTGFADPTSTRLSTPVSADQVAFEALDQRTRVWRLPVAANQSVITPSLIDTLLTGSENGP